jgi:hypothetical protein
MKTIVRVTIKESCMARENFNPRRRFMYCEQQGHQERLPRKIERKITTILKMPLFLHTNINDYDEKEE